MDISQYILKAYPTVEPYSGVSQVEEELLDNHYLAVIDENGEFFGILTPDDLIKRPHKIVVDCLTPKESITAQDTVTTIMEKFSNNNTPALPFIKDNAFAGIICKSQVVSGMGQQIVELHDKALLSDKVKTSFLCNLSHELRTPLNGVLGFIELLSNFETEKVTDQHSQYSSLIRKSADRFLFMMNDLVDLSLISSGDQVIINKEMVNIEELLTELLEEFNGLLDIQHSDTKVEYHLPPEDKSRYFYTDRKRLRHIMYHLIDNAVKFNEKDNVVVGFESPINTSDLSLFVVNRTARRVNSKCFDIFQKQDYDSQKRFNSGLGIGLSVVKALTELLGGSVDVNVSANKVKFFVTLSDTSDGALNSN